MSQPKGGVWLMKAKVNGVDWKHPYDGKPCNLGALEDMFADVLLEANGTASRVEFHIERYNGEVS